MNNAVLSIGTTHPWNIAGTGLDAQVIREYSMRALTVVAAVSAQDATGVHALHVVPAQIVEAQLDAIPEVAAVRIGALGVAANARIVARWLEGRDAPAVVDPVMHASLGGALSDSEAVGAVLEVASARAGVLTPNAAEAETLAGMEVSTVAQMREAAKALRARGIATVLVKGGHVSSGDAVVDVLAHANGIEEFRSERLPVTMRGTGCTLAAALACELAAGNEIVEAVERARRYVRAKIASQKTFAGLNTAF